MDWTTPRTSGLIALTLITIWVGRVRPPPRDSEAGVLSPPSVPSPGCHHEPPGLTPIFDESWDELPPVAPKTSAGGWNVRSRRERTSRLSIVQDPAAPISPPNVIQGLFPAGGKGGSAPFRLNRRFDRTYSVLYLCMATKIDPRFTNNGNAGTKFGYFLSPYDNGKGKLNHYINLTARMGVNLESHKGELNRNIRSSFNLLAQRGTWHRIELVLYSNRDGLSNGSLQMWADDRMVLNEFSIKFFYPGQDPGFSGITWNPTYGGGHNPVPYDMYQWIDNWYMSGS